MYLSGRYRVGGWEEVGRRLVGQKKRTSARMGLAGVRYWGAGWTAGEGYSMAAAMRAAREESSSGVISTWWLKLRSPGWLRGMR